MKYLATLVVFIFLLNYSYGEVHASLIKISKSGEIVINVLGEHLDREVEVTKLAVSGEPKNSKVDLTRNENMIMITVSDNFGEKTLEVTDFGEGLVEIEDRPKAQKLTIGTENDMYILKQGEIVALTAYDLSVDPKTSRLSLTTPQGIKYISIFPKDATELLLRAKILTEVTNDKISIVEQTGGLLVYAIEGKKILKLLNLWELPVDVKSFVSTSNGEVVNTQQPVWLPIVSFLLNG